MTPREKQLIRESFPILQEVAGPLSLLFYGRLFELEPRLRSLFHGDIRRQGVKLMEMLTSVVEGMDNLEALTPALHSMGQRHVGYGVDGRHYELVEEAFVWALGHALGENGNSDAKAAWRKVIGEVSVRMKEGAARG